MSQFHSYSPKDGHGLPHNPFKALISPRPIAWISTVSPDGGYNLAPYSFFGAFSETPPIIGFSSLGWKDSVRNIEASGEFVHNLATRNVVSEMVETSAPMPYEHSEFERAGLTPIASEMVAPPRVGEASGAFECKLIELKQLHDAAGEKTDNYFVLGEVVRIHIAHDVIEEGLVDERKLGLVSRLGYLSYLSVSDLFEMHRPKK